MKTLSRNQFLTAAVLAAVTFGLPAAASAQSYNQAGYDYVQCKKSDKDNQLVGGLLGAIAGGVLGSQVSGNGARTEGSVLGAVVGAAAGAGIADDNRNCTKEAQAVSGQTYGSAYGTTYRSSSRRNSAPTYSRRGYSTIKYGASQPARPAYGHTSYGQPSYGHRGGNRVENIKYRIEALRAERDQLQARQRRHYSRHNAQRIASIGAEIGRLKDRKRNIKARY